eukprot:GHUV01014328.1.p1 GENE.GHUV01014328.1~~GHUV01014328.1.p1  ORF type:complete len:249 (+),score=27.33 GHUV01014328.1:1824-2570(+)
MISSQVDDRMLLCQSYSAPPRKYPETPQPLVFVNWPELFLNVTPWSPSCYKYTVVAEDCLSLVAWRAGVPLERLMLDNVGVVKDLDAPITGKQLILCSTEGKGVNAVQVQLHGVFVNPELAAPGLPPQVRLVLLNIYILQLYQPLHLSVHHGHAVTLPLNTMNVAHTMYVARHHATCQACGLSSCTHLLSILLYLPHRPDLLGILLYLPHRPELLGILFYLPHRPDLLSILLYYNRLPHWPEKQRDIA